VDAEGKTTLNKEEHWNFRQGKHVEAIEKRKLKAAGKANKLVLWYTVFYNAQI